MKSLSEQLHDASLATATLEHMIEFQKTQIKAANALLMDASKLIAELGISEFDPDTGEVSNLVLHRINEYLYS